MRNYEATLILSPQASETAVNDALQELASFVQEEGGILDGQSMAGKKPLLSPIRTQTEAYLAILSFNLNQEKLPNLEQKLKNKEEVLRYLLLAKRRRKTPKLYDRPSLEKQRERQGESLPAERTEQTRPEQKKEEKIELKDLDEKLREIFKEDYAP